MKDKNEVRSSHSSIGDVVDLAKNCMEKSFRYIDDATDLSEKGSFDSAANRSYYAIFSAMTAPL